MGTTWVCIATNEAPNIPALSRHIGSCFDTTALKISAKPSLTSFLNKEISETKIKPVPNETRAASRESPIRSDNSPFIRDCKAINTPENAETTSNPRNLLGLQI